MFNWLFNSKATLPREFRKLLDPDALAIVERLNKAGLETYFVGGCVRDILLNKKPKDFDIATKATPQQVKSLIHRSFIIGRRFRIVVAKRRDFGQQHHDFEGEENLFPLLNPRPKEKEIQITTFRRDPIEVDGKVNENVFGTAEEDASRRDFTMNALFLDPGTGKIIDYCGGLNDLRKRRLRVIGDPWARFKEDPIRILRALRFTSRAQLKFEAQTEAALRENIPMLAESKKERIREEVLKTFKEGVAFEVFSRFNKHQIWTTFSPAFADYLTQNKQAMPHIEAVGRAMNRCHWAHAQQPAPFFYMLFLEFIRSGLEPEAPSFAKVLDDFKVSRAEREEILRIRQILTRVQRDPEAQQATRLLGRNIRHYATLSQAFYVLKILADANIAPYSKLWSKWKESWIQYVRAVVGGTPQSSSASTRGGHRGSREANNGSSASSATGGARRRPRRPRRAPSSRRRPPSPRPATPGAPAMGVSTASATPSSGDSSGGSSGGTGNDT